MDEATLEKVETKPENKAPDATPEELRAIKETYSSDRNQLLLQHPWFGMIIMGLSLNASQEIPIAGVTYTKIFFNPIHSSRRKNGCKSYPELKSDTRLFLLCHELLHPSLGHCSYPASNAYNHRLQNIAMDAVINRILCDKGGKFSSYKEAIRTDIAGGVFIGSDTDVLEIGIPGSDTFYSIKIPGLLNADWPYIYECLIKASQGSDAGKLKIAAEAFGDKFLDTLEDPEADSSSLSTDRTSFLTRVSGISQNHSSTPGSCPGEVEMYISALFSPKISWTRRLRSSVEQSIVKEDFSFRVNSRKAHIAILPLLDPKPVYNVYVALDTSGSMSDRDISEALGELKGLRDTYPMTLTVIQCDYAISDVKVYDDSQDINWEKFSIAGRGGTTFVPPITYVNELYENGEIAPPSVFVYFTDGYGDFPEQPEYPVIWVRAKNGYKDFPFGEIIDIE